MGTITTALLVLVLLGTYPALAQDYGKVCPNSMIPQQAAAAGCRWVGGVGGYDICANPGAEKYPQCAALYQPHNAEPSNYQVWVAVIMPTQNCEKYNASGQRSHPYDCSVWCKGFLRNNSTAVSRPQLPAICDKYGQPQQPPTKSCQAAVPPAGGGPLPEQTIINMTELWMRRINNYWSAQFPSHGLGIFRPPMLIRGAGPNDLFEDDATRSITYNPAILNAIIGQTGVFGMVIALAHEDGHYVQLLIGRRLTPQIRQELDADTLSGNFLHWAQRQGFLRECDLGAALMGTFQVGDNLPSFNPDAHGTAQQRVTAVMRGYTANDPDLSGSNPFINPPNPFPGPGLLPRN